MSKTFTAADVAAHKTPQDLYIIVDGDVYDVTKFQEDHPGSFSLSHLSCPFCAAPPAARWSHRTKAAPHRIVPR